MACPAMHQYVGPYDAKDRQAISPGKYCTALNMGVFMNIAYD